MTPASTCLLPRPLIALIVSAFYLTTLAGPASAVLIDFESFPAGPFASHTQSGVTFSAVGGGGLILNTSTPNGTLGLLDDNSPRKELRADIAPHASFVSVDLGDFNADGDLLFLEVFNASNVSQGFTSLPILPAFEGMLTLSLSASDIAYAIFGARSPAINGNSVFADNFRFTPLPEPTSMMLAAIGMIFGSSVCRRRKPHRA